MYATHVVKRSPSGFIKKKINNTVVFLEMILLESIEPKRNMLWDRFYKCYYFDKTYHLIVEDIICEEDVQATFSVCHAPRAMLWSRKSIIQTGDGYVQGLYEESPSSFLKQPFPSQHWSLKWNPTATTYSCKITTSMLLQLFITQ